MPLEEFLDKALLVWPRVGINALLAIPRRNVETLSSLGIEKVRARLKAADSGPGE
jgi:hypothetical protein